MIHATIFTIIYESVRPYAIVSLENNERPIFIQKKSIVIFFD